MAEVGGGQGGLGIHLFFPTLCPAKGSRSVSASLRTRASPAGADGGTTQAQASVPWAPLKGELGSHHEVLKSKVFASKTGASQG